MATPMLIPLKARDIVYCNVYGGTVNTAGGVVWTTPIDLCNLSGVNVYDNFEVNPEFESGDFTPSDNFVRTMVTEKVGFAATLSDIVQAYTYQTGFAAGYPSVVEAIIAQYAYVKVVAQYRAIGTTATPFYRGVLGNMKPGQIGGINSQTGKRVTTLTVEPSGYQILLGTTGPPASWS